MEGMQVFSDVQGYPVFQEDNIEIFLTFKSPQKIAQATLAGFGQTIIISMDTFCKELDDSLEFLPISLEDISRFYDVLTHKKNSCQHIKILICTGPVNRIQFGTVFLIGCYMLIRGKGLNEVQSALCPFDDIMSGFDCNGMSHKDFWSAFYRAQRNKWVSFYEPDGDTEFPSSTSIEIEEYAHYARYW